MRQPEMYEDIALLTSNVIFVRIDCLMVSKPYSRKPFNTEFVIYNAAAFRLKVSKMKT